MSIFCNPLKGVAIAVLSVLPLVAGAENPTPAAVGNANQAAPATQKIAVNPEEQSRKMLEQYRDVMRQTENLKVLNQNLKDQLEAQKIQKASLEKQLIDVEITKPGAVPLILRMLSSLDKFVAADLPFLPEERKQRLQLLQQTVVKADVSTAEKFRRVMEAYQIENEYGKTIEAYKADITLNNAKTAVDFLRLGRVALYYSRLDGSEVGVWNKAEKRWDTLSSDHSGAIRNGLRIARKEAAPDLLVVPVSAPEAAQ